MPATCATFFNVNPQLNIINTAILFAGIYLGSYFATFSWLTPSSPGSPPLARYVTVNLKPQQISIVHRNHPVSTKVIAAYKPALTLHGKISKRRIEILAFAGKG